MGDNVIWLNRPSASLDSPRRKDRNVALVEAAFQFVVSHPFTDGDADEVRLGMTREDAQIVADVIGLALRLAQLGPAEFEAWASKDMAYYEHWLRHYEKQVRRFLEG
ncbi:MAG: hypothetical protein KJ587_08420 [Alphaproteobacteria bacterium]|nr:hypothetical protein [Alphaproteobacteria bacterium]